MIKYTATKREKSVLSNLNFPVGRLNPNNDTHIEISNSHSKEFDFLCFFDSRGGTLNGDKSRSISGLLINHFRSLNRSFIIICRPLELTVFFTLFNFLHFNDYKARNLTTNMGFVDFIPKKKKFVEDIILQKAVLFDDIECKLEPLEEYTLSDGSREVLRYLDQNPCASSFSNCLDKQFESIYLIKTPEFKNGCLFQRKRPNSFYAQSKKTNMFIDRISDLSNKARPIPLPISDNVFDHDPLRFSYDGVHYTDLGHNFIFNKICERIEYDNT